MKIRNMQSPNGNDVPNQFIIEDGNAACFQSYDSIIVKKTFGVEGRIVLDEKYWNYSKTTGKYRNIFLGESKAETERKIAAGIYRLEDLNK